MTHFIPSSIHFFHPEPLDPILGPSSPSDWCWAPVCRRQEERLAEKRQGQPLQSNNNQIACQISTCRVWNVPPPSLPPSLSDGSKQLMHIQHARAHTQHTHTNTIKQSIRQAQQITWPSFQPVDPSFPRLSPRSPSRPGTDAQIDHQRSLTNHSIPCRQTTHASTHARNRLAQAAHQSPNHSTRLTLEHVPSHSSTCSLPLHQTSHFLARLEGCHSCCYLAIKTLHAQALTS